MYRATQTLSNLLATLLVWPSIALATVAGNTAGQFAVSPQGAATYNIPIAVSPGTAGIQPKLSLMFNSHSGNGLLGVGWSLSGLSAITRCPQTVARNGINAPITLTKSDHFCLDGQPLIAKSGAYGGVGTEYRTVIDGFSKIVSYGNGTGGPLSFKAWTKSGQIIEYGNSTDSFINTQVNSSTALLWAMNRIQDSVGNFMTVSYVQNSTTGEYYPSRMDYTGNVVNGTPTYSSVLFVYATRPDLNTSFVANQIISSTKRLTNVQVYEGTTITRDYRLTYDVGSMTSRSRLTNVTECDSNSVSALCLPATTFSWADGAQANGFTHSGGDPSINPKGTVRAIDVDGDGKTDLVSCVDSTSTWQVTLRNGSGFNAPLDTGIACGTNMAYALPVDFDGNGTVDLLVPGTSNWNLLKSSRLGTLQLTDTGIPDTGYNMNPQIMDVDGDGRPDIVYVGANSHWWVAFNHGTTITQVDTLISSANYQYARPIEYNADGLVDLLIPNSGTWYVLVGNSTGFTKVDTNISGGAYTGVLTMDVNGDGRPDIVYPSAGNWHYRLNFGNNTFSTDYDTGIASGPATDYQYAFLADFNGDGLIDLIFPQTSNGSGEWKVLQKNKNNALFGPTAFSLVSSGILINGYITAALAGDFNGDGQTDLLWTWSSVMASSTVRPYLFALGWNLYLHNGGQSDQLTTLTNGLGAIETITYKPLTDPGVYTVGTNTTFPQQDFQGALYVVAGTSTSDGTGGLYALSYAYSGARIDRQGDGFLGFATMVTFDPQIGISTEDDYSQTFPTTGMLTATTKRLNGATIASTSYVLAAYTYGTNGYYFPYVSSQIETSYELPGGNTSAVSTVMTSNTYNSACASDDAYCDLATVTITTKAGSNTFTKTITNTYQIPDNANWILGRLSQTQVQNTRPDGTYATRTSSFTYYSSGLLWTEVVEPNGNIGSINNIKQTTTYTYDSAGNKTGATVSGADGISRPATAADNASTAGAPYAYTAGRFETNLTNAASQGETRAYDARYGTVSTLTGPNNLSTKWQYDSFGRKLTETRADNTTTTWTYNLCGSCSANAKYYVVQATSGAPTVTQYFDMLDRELRTQTAGYNGALIYKDTVYNSLGQVAKVSQPYYSSEVPFWTYFTYDALGRVTSQSLPTQASTAGTLLGKTTYSGLTTAVTQYRDGTALTATQVKDAIGELVSVTDANSKTTTYQYDPFGNLLKVTDPALNVTTMTYDIRGRKLTMTDPDMGYWQYFYDSVGELIKQIDAKGQTVTMDYDSLGRIWHRWEPESLTPILYSYDNTTLSGPAAKGKLSQISWPGNNTRTFVYDNFGRPISETTNLNGSVLTMKTAYDSYSRVSTITYPSNYAVNNNYDANGYLVSVTDAVLGYAYWSAPSYTAEGQYAAYTLGNGLTTVNQFDPATGLIKGISTGVGTGSATQYLTYQYDTLGNLKQRVDGNQGNLTENFGYDNLNRLITASVGTSINKTVSYDSIGNITNKSDVGLFTYDPLHKHAVKTAGSGSYTYDANGNQLTGPNGRTLTYNSFNQPTSIIQNGKTYSYAYDPDHLRAVEAAPDGLTVFMHPRMDQGARFEWVRLNSGVVELKHFIYAGKEVVALYTTRSNNFNDLRYFHKDHLGSIDTITNETGGVVERLSYDAWGKRRNGNWTDATTAITSLTHHGFTGHEMLDDVGLINMNGRIYDPTLGRFLSADPTMQDPANPQVLNRYTYANNNPLSITDPSGYCWALTCWIQKPLAHAWHVVTNNPTLRAIVSIAAAVFLPGSELFASIGLTGVGAQMAAGFVSGIISSDGSIKDGAIAAMTAGLFDGLHAWQPGGFGANFTESVEKSIAHGVVGGVSSVLQGGKFGSGFMAAGFTQVASLSGVFNNLGDAGTLASRAENAAAAALVGGTASVVGGGKFANGAVTGAFSRLFNDLKPDNNQDPAVKEAIDRTNAQASAMQAAYGPSYNTDPPATGKQIATGLVVVAGAATAVGFVYDGVEVGYVVYTALAGAYAADPSTDNLESIVYAGTTDGLGALFGPALKTTMNAYGFIVTGGGLAPSPLGDRPH